MARYQNYQRELFNEEPKEFAKTSRMFAHNKKPLGFTGETWDAKHMTNFLSQSHYSNWRGDQPNISRVSSTQHRKTYSNSGDHFFKTTKEDKNQSKIGCTPVFPLVSNISAQPQQEKSLNQFFQTGNFPHREERIVSGRSLRLRCSPDEKFKFEGNAVKFKSTNPLTMQHEEHPTDRVTGYQKQRMNRLIQRRHPHGMTGIDHPENPQSKYYNLFEQKIRIRQQPNSHNSFMIDREWKTKKRSVPPVDHWKVRQTVNIRKFRNENIHGFNIVTNRKVEP